MHKILSFHNYNILFCFMNINNTIKEKLICFKFLATIGTDI